MPNKPNGKDEEWIKNLEYNSTDCGELGVFIRLEYASNILREALQKQREQFIKQIENKDLPKGGVYTPQYMKDYAEGYNACLQEVLQILNR